MNSEIIESIRQLLGPLYDDVFEKAFPHLIREGVRKLVECFKRRSKERKMEGVNPDKSVTFEALRSISPFQTTVHAEYLSGILLGSGVTRADESVSLIYLIRQLSSSQLLLHYHIYHALGQQLFQKFAHDKEEHNPARHPPEAIVFEYSPLSSTLAVDLAVLEHHSLIDSWRIGRETIDEDCVLNYAYASRSNLGTMLYAAAQNELQGWFMFGKKGYHDIPGIKPPKLPGLYARYPNHLISQAKRRKDEG